MVTTDVRVLSELAASIHVDAAPRMDTFRRRALNITEYTSDAALLRTGRRSQCTVRTEGGHLKTDPAFGASRIIIIIFACVAKCVVEALQKAL